MVGVGRTLVFALHKAKLPKRQTRRRNTIKVREVAILIAAHNEEQVIRATIIAAKRLVKPSQIYIISDCSKDKTVQIARSRGVNALDLRKHRGKAGALVAGIKYYKLLKHYKVIALLDADTHLSRDYLRTGLPLFNDEGVSAVAGHAMTMDDRGSSSAFGRFLLSYRQRLYLMYQYLIKYGQGAKWANAISIVPGFASMYKTDALKHINIAAPGIIIEDYNMTFDFHASRLGRIAFRPNHAVAYTQDPDTMNDYINQCVRWALGFWQAVYHHKMRLGIFWIALTIFIIELIVSSLLLCILLPFSIGAILSEQLGMHSTFLSQLPNPYYLLIGVFLQDYILSIFAGIVLKRPRYLLLGLGFLLLRIVDATISLWALKKAFFLRSSGIWKSPMRRPIRPIAEVGQRAL